MKSLVLQDDEWLRGKQDSGLDFKGKKCCLGILGYKLGAKRGSLKGCSTPMNAIDECEWPKGLLTKRFGEIEDTKLTDRIVETNDNLTIDDETRLERLGRLFKKIGYRLVFKKNK